MTTIDDATLLIDQPVGAKPRLSVRLATAELRVTAADTDRIAVRTPDGSSVASLIVDGDRDAVTIREKETLGLIIGRRRPTAVLEITVPASTEVVTEIASGDTETDGLRGPQRHRSVSGDLRIFDAAGPIELNTVSGPSVVELSGEADVAIRTVSGDVAVSGGTLAAVRVSTTSGDVQLDSPLTGRSGNAIETLSGDVSIRVAHGVRVEARTVSGDLTSDQPHRSEGRMGRRTLVVGDGAIELAFRSVSGDLHVRGGGGTTPSERRLIAGSLQDHPDPSATSPGGLAGLRDEDRMAILRAVERGELEVAAAMAQLSALDGHQGTMPADDGAPAESSTTDA